MSERLSQEEIDALISSFQSGGESAIEQLESMNQSKVEYRPYDFNRPEKFSNENLQSIDRMATSFAKSLSQTLTARVRTSINVELAGIEQIPFVTDYADIMPKNYYGFFVTDLGHPDLHEIVIELDLAFIMALHKRWLGSELPKELSIRRPLSEYEVYTAKKLLESSIYENLETAFDSIIEISPSFVSYQNDSQLLKITSGTDMIALVTLNIASEYWETTMRLVIPFESVESIIDKMTVENMMQFSHNKKKKSYKEEIGKGLENVLEEVYISVGSTRMTLNELKQVEVGDVLKFNNRVNEPAKGFAAGVEKFTCLIGRDNKRKAFRFLDFTESSLFNSESEKELKGG